jgi:transcriptional regulator
MSDVQQSDHVHQLRARGLAPKQIARALGLPQAEVIAVLNRTATEDSAAAGEQSSEIRC